MFYVYTLVWRILNVIASWALPNADVVEITVYRILQIIEFCNLSDTCTWMLLTYDSP